MPEDTARVGRWLFLMAGVVIVVALGVTAILLARSGTEEASTKPASKDAARSPAPNTAAAEPSTIDGLTVLTGEEALRQDARWYARDMGVSLEEAMRRLDMQDDTLPTDLEIALKNTERDSFAGLWIRHNPGFGLTIATAGDPEDMARKIESIVAGTRWEGTVNVKSVEASLVELNDARANAERMLDRLGIPYSSGDNIMKNRTEINVKDKEKLQRKLHAAGLKLPEHVIVIEGMAVMLDGAK